MADKKQVISHPYSPLTFATDLKTMAVGTALLAGTVIGSYYLIKKEVEKKKADSAAERSMEPGSAENFAIRLGMAIDNGWKWWANVEEIMKIIKEIPSKAVFRAVESAYKAQLKNPMVNDIRDKFNIKEFNQYLAAYKAKPETLKLKA